MGNEKKTSYTKPSTRGKQNNTASTALRFNNIRPNLEVIRTSHSPTHIDESEEEPRRVYGVKHAHPRCLRKLDNSAVNQVAPLFEWQSAPLPEECGVKCANGHHPTRHYKL